MSDDDPIDNGPATTALLARRSVRAFSEKAVQREQVVAILAAALRAPSGGNLQPWHVHVVAGAALDRLKNRMATIAAAGDREATSHAVYPDQLWEPYRSRRFVNGEALYATIGLSREDRPARLEQLARNYQLFGAPVGLFFVTEKRMGNAQRLDLGIFMQSVMLAALDHGLATCPQAAWAQWPTIMRETLFLGDHAVVVAGMALGHEDHAHPINTLRTVRQSVVEAATFHNE